MAKASTPPYFVQKPTSQHVEEGSGAKFTCQVHGIPAPKVKWQLNGCDLANDGRIQVYS
jgi:hypothetical protein